MSISEAFITSTGSFLPGPPIGNEDMESVLGYVDGKPSRLKQKILRSNGIKSRHYALNSNQKSTYQNSELAEQAASNCIDRSSISRREIDLVAVGSTQGDLPLPGLASMVQAELDIPACEIITTHGVCTSGVMALKAAFNQVRLQEKHAALVCASELSSRLLKSSRYEAATGGALDLEAEFLRWMLSDGAGACILEPKPKANGISLRIDWIESISYAADFDLCMSCGTAEQSQWGAGHFGIESSAAPSSERLLELQKASQRASTATLVPEKSWQDYTTYADAEKSGALLIRQNLRILDNIVKVGVEGFLGLIKAGKIAPHEIDYFVCHYSSHMFRGKIVDLLTRAGCMVPEEKWFTNLYTKGNTGCASIFIMLDDLFRNGNLKNGQVLFCTIPESGRFNTSFMKLTVVGG